MKGLRNGSRNTRIKVVVMNRINLLRILYKNLDSGMEKGILKSLAEEERKLQGS